MGGEGMFMGFINPWDWLKYLFSSSSNSQNSGEDVTQ